MQRNASPLGISVALAALGPAGCAAIGCANNNPTSPSLLWRRNACRDIGATPALTPGPPPPSTSA